jgi:hypothetical protein
MLIGKIELKSNLKIKFTLRFLVRILNHLVHMPWNVHYIIVLNATDQLTNVDRGWYLDGWPSGILHAAGYFVVHSASTIEEMDSISAKKMGLHSSRL